MQLVQQFMYESDGVQGKRGRKDWKYLIGENINKFWCQKKGGGDKCLHVLTLDELTSQINIGQTINMFLKNKSKSYRCAY